MTRRFPLMLVAFLVALLAAGVVLAVGVLAPDFLGVDSDRMERIRFFGAAFFTTGYGPAFALLLALAAVVVGEAVRMRSVLYYVVVGAMIALATAYNVDLSAALENTTDIEPVIFGKTVAAAAGLLGGLVYWAIAVRRATAAG
jgi:hypothetical protein